MSILLCSSAVRPAPKSVSESITLAVLKSWDVPVADVKMVAIGDFGAGLTALEHNKIDIAIIPEPIYSQKEKAGVKYKVLPWLDEKLPAYAQTVGIATDEAIAKNGPKLKAVIEARRRGVEFLYANPKESAAILAKAYNLPADVAANAINNILKMNPAWWSRGDLKQPLMEAMAEALGSVGALQLPVDWKAAINASFVPPAAKTQ
jgi:NitT/TauT family transport system substrate-binding protein